MADSINRFEKMNKDIYALAEKMLEDQDLCKLIYYAGKYPLRGENVNGYKNLLDKRVLPFKRKIPRPDEQGTYILIRPENIRGSRGGNLIKSQLVFDVYTSEQDKQIFDKDGDFANREMLIMAKIDEFMRNIGLSIGENGFGMAGTVETRNSEFTGYSVIYDDVDFREMSK